ncbi:hypothetical protein AMECASPLE_022187 [Ameca splendens]|uniref:Uncharacterized protein n=1 Tax=Ameca splendens TaxID=208324 RepID=A0ABV0YR71_9TELE
MKVQSTVCTCVNLKGSNGPSLSGALLKLGSKSQEHLKDNNKSMGPQTGASSTQMGQWTSLNASTIETSATDNRADAILQTSDLCFQLSINQSVSGNPINLDVYCSASDKQKEEERECIKVITVQLVQVQQDRRPQDHFTNLNDAKTNLCSFVKKEELKKSLGGSAVCVQKGYSS